MGTIVSQSIKNTLTTYLGFLVGGINVLFLFTNFMSDTYFGLVTFIFSTANIMMPLMAFGVHNTIIKFYSSYKTRQSQNSFLLFMLILPLSMVVSVGLLGHLFYYSIRIWLTETNVIIEDYIWLIYISGVAFAYFEVFYAWSKVHMQSVFGNFMKELFHRVGTTLLLILLYVEYITIEEFIYAVVGVYIVRVFIMMLYAFNIKLPVLRFARFNGVGAILKYTSLIVIAGSVANVILEVDKFMLGYYIDIENVAYYGVAIYIASVIGVPLLAMEQIVNPITAKLLNDKNIDELKSLYKKSSLSLFVISGLIFLLIVLNVNELYHLIPEKYNGGLWIVILISISKLTDNLLGNNNAILFNSDYYFIALLLGVFLMVSMVYLNILFIPKYGIEGAAYATFIAVLLYNISKICFVRHSFKMMPFTINTIKVFVLISVSFGVFYFWDFPFHPILNIGLKSVMVFVTYAYFVYNFKLSNDVSLLVDKIVGYLK
ncbi:lipopolysaccharide biosynthesis protein [Confluentibacter flavum]|uniref:Sugar isomerase n=1 Tax=Confluentibacter flavum TaxID=1909700 RepID=A0A2N3HGS1_9FLAO|nr:polysaccharide biosynthesis C-terminal domain-containing protein [Confluentibacter flavum]PKQ44092.1 sugar isomerase [Confluentibacter flavum]